MLEEKADKMTTEFNYIKEWILTFLSTPQTSLNGFPPCPYARKSLIEKKIKFFKSVDYFKDICDLFDTWDDSIEVAICVVRDEEDPDLFAKNVTKINDIYLSKGFGALEDHVKIPEIFLDLSFNNGRYNIILCQQMEKLNQASAHLLSKGYYNNWTSEMYDNVVSWRLQGS